MTTCGTEKSSVASLNRPFTSTRSKPAVHIMPFQVRTLGRQKTTAEGSSAR